MELVFGDTYCRPNAKEAGCYQQLFNWAHKWRQGEKTRDPWAGIIYEQAPAHKWKKAKNHICRTEIEKLTISASVPVNINGDFD
jgi:hypothetical protein